MALSVHPIPKKRTPRYMLPLTLEATPHSTPPLHSRESSFPEEQMAGSPSGLPSCRTLSLRLLLATESTDTLPAPKHPDELPPHFLDHHKKKHPGSPCAAAVASHSPHNVIQLPQIVNASSPISSSSAQVEKTSSIARAHIVTTSPPTSPLSSDASRHLSKGLSRTFSTDNSLSLPDTFESKAGLKPGKRQVATDTSPQNTFFASGEESASGTLFPFPSLSHVTREEEETKSGSLERWTF